MTAAWTDNQKPWKISSLDRPVGLELVLQERTLVLPWTQFLYAEGGDDEIRLAFSTHDVTVSGNHLCSLLADLSAQRVSLLRAPVRAEKFRTDTGPWIAGISVRKVE